MTCEALLALPGVVQELEVVVEEKKGEASDQNWDILAEFSILQKFRRLPFPNYIYMFELTFLSPSSLPFWTPLPCQ